MIAERRDFYVYVWFRPDGTPCYVGKGTKGRWLSFYRGHNLHLARTIAKAGGKLPSVKTHEGLSEIEALAIEIAMIAAIGRHHRGGPLLNLTDGGEGSSGVPLEIIMRRAAKTSAKLKGRKRSPDAIEKSAAGIRGRKRGPHSAAHRARISAAHMGKTVSAEVREKMSASRRGRALSADQKRKIGNAHRGKIMTDDARQKMREAWARNREQRRQICREAWVRRRALQESMSV